MTLTDAGPTMPFMTTMIKNMQSFMLKPIFPRAGTEMMFSLRWVTIIFIFNNLTPDFVPGFTSALIDDLNMLLFFFNL